MPPKRRISHVDGDDSDDDRSRTPELGRKRKKMDPNQQMTSLYEFLRRYKREDGSDLCDYFVRAPKRRSDPAYYEIVNDPIDMLRIQQKLKTDEYSDLEELKLDIQKLLDNAFLYYKKGSDEHKAACELTDLYEKAVERVEAGEDPVASLGNREDSEDTDLLEDLFASVIAATDPGDSSRPLHMVFRLLPSQKRYPDYYKHIKDPIDLKQIAMKIQSGDYSCLAELEEDLQRMCKNAQQFNEPGSQIFRDAKSILKLVKSKKYELEVNKQARENRGSRNTRRLTGKKHFSAEIAELQYEDSESEESEEDEVDGNDPLWVLYSFVRGYQTTSGVKLAEPFLTLPSKRELPDYYSIIDDPISFNEIRKKLKSGEYNTLEDLTSDFNLMFENCKAYNRPESRLYKDSARLQKAMSAKLEELEMDDEDQDENEAKSPSRSPKDQMKKKLRVLYNSVLNFRSREGIQLIGMFMEKPSRKDYPDYYEVITNPIDMTIINDRIKSGQYKTEEDLIADMKVMFNNCRQYNEEGSDIYHDANTLERILLSKAKDMGLSVGPGRRKRKTVKELSEKLKILFETLRDHKDNKGRQLSLIFLRLPNPKEFPDYFEVIKTPIDFEKVNFKVKQSLYATMEECLADFVLMFDNACKYNEPDSQIYKDALTLQSLAHRTCRRLIQDDDDIGVPDVAGAVQEILSHIFTSVYNHQDSEERCYSDSLAELPEHDEVDAAAPDDNAVSKSEDGEATKKEKKKVRALSFDIIKRRMDRGLYKRLDLFQKDVFAVLERARNIARSDSQVFEDSVELQAYFIKVRDEACGGGGILQSRALLFTHDDLMAAVNSARALKQANEAPEEETQTQEQHQEQKQQQSESSTTSATFNQQQYNVGDFVYVESSADNSTEPLIHYIENIYAKDGEQIMYSNHFFRPVETFHVSSRKFLLNEVFRTDVHSSTPLSKISGRCIVVPVRDYFRLKPEGFEDKDVFVCESRYNSKARSFKKMKLYWNTPENVKMVARDVPLEPKRVMSIFKERIEKHKEEIEELEAMVRTVEEEQPKHVPWDNPDVLDASLGNAYFEQYSIPGPITLRRGDTVYVRSENGKNLIAQIDKMWVGEDGVARYEGPWFVTPSEIPASLGLTFYKQEVLLSSISDVNPLLSVVGRCAVLEMKDYVKQRPTQYGEADVFICESSFDESKNTVRGPIEGTLKTYEHSSDVQADEIYIFKQPITVVKESASSSGKSQSALMDIDNEDSLDALPSIDSSADNSMQATPSQSKSKVKPGKKIVTPYILFSSEIRRVIVDQNKTCTFGEISRLVGDKWRQLSDHEKQIYEEKAKKLNEENAIKFAEEQKTAEEQRRRQELVSTPSTMGFSPMMRGGATNGHASNATSMASAVPGLSMGPVGMPPKPSTPNCASPGPQNRPPSQGPPTMKMMEPIFHTVPPRAQRLLHSEAYIRYIEGLSADSHIMSNWERQLNASRDNTRTEEAKLPAHWLVENGEHGTSLDALWALRDFMMSDSLGVLKMV